MTALTMPARPEHDADLRPVPWQRMAWVTWRQHRLALGGMAALLGALAVYLLITGLRVHNAWDAAAACHPASSLACQQGIFNNFNGTYGPTAAGVAVLLQAVPVVIGAFVGAPVLARELETGTFRYAWTQGIGRWRWTVAKLVALAAVVAAAGGLFGWLFSWYIEPFFASGYDMPFDPKMFDLRVVTFAAWTLAAFAIGVLAGMLIRRVVPAIAATLVVYAGLAITTGAFLRQHYMAPLLTSSQNVPGTAWVTSQWWTKGGQRVSQSTITQVLRGASPGQIAAKGNGVPKSPSVPQYLAQHGYTQWTSYQPGSRFWPFQWIEGGWLLALSVLLIAVTVWLVRRRAS